METNLTTTTKETLTSMEVAEMINKDHSKLLRDIRRYINQMKKINETKIGLVDNQNLGESKIGHSNNQNLGETKIAPTDFFQETTYISLQNKSMSCYNITRKGCDFLANKLTGTKGTEFTARYVNRFHELEENNFTNILVSTLNTISESMNIMKKEINNRLTKLEESNQIQSQPALTTTYKKPFNPWFKKMSPKYTLLEEYFDITRGQLYRNILNELENLYDIDTSQIQADYLYENNLTSSYPLEPYEYNPKYRDMIEHIINTNLIKYKIASENDPITSTRHITIFDSPVRENSIEETSIKNKGLCHEKELTH